MTFMMSNASNQYTKLVQGLAKLDISEEVVQKCLNSNSNISNEIDVANVHFRAQDVNSAIKDYQKVLRDLVSG